MAINYIFIFQTHVMYILYVSPNPPLHQLDPDRLVFEYNFIRLKIKPNSVRYLFPLPSEGFYFYIKLFWKLIQVTLINVRKGKSIAWLGHPSNRLLKVRTPKCWNIIITRVAYMLALTQIRGVIIKLCQA